MKKKLLCTDMDGTILDSRELHHLSYKKALKGLGFPQVSTKTMQKHLGKPHDEVAKAFLPKTATKKDQEKLIKEKAKALKTIGKSHIKRIPYAEKTLKKLKKDYKIILLSNCSKDTIQHMLEGANIDKKIFFKILGRDSVKRSKPFPDGILKAQELANQKVDYMMGDTTYDILAGKKAKVKTIALAQGWHSKAKLKKEKPDIFLDHIKDLPELLKKC